MSTRSPLTPRYLARLGLPPDTLAATVAAAAAAKHNNSSAPSLPQQPLVDLLHTIQERHLAHIPFENTAQHGVCGEKDDDDDDDDDGSSHTALPAQLDVERTARKILDLRRGGFCYELNGLLAAWLDEMNQETMGASLYSVCRVPAIVHKGTSFDGPATHLILIVQCCCRGSDEDEDPAQQQPQRCCCYYVDVGFGEPPLQPLAYGPDWFGKEQITGEGMRSRLDLVFFHHPNDANNTTSSSEEPVVVLSWFRNGAWVPRLQWKYAASRLRQADNGAGRPPPPALTDPCFRDGLARVLQPGSIFAQKLVCCRLTRARKVTLAGHRLKTTQPRGFFGGEGGTAEDAGDASVTEEEIASNEDGRRILESHFGIPLTSSEGLDLGPSKQADPAVWSHL